jgi:hypothetical protein
MLQRAYEVAGTENAHIWDYAIEARALRAAGVTDTDLRWLISKGYVEHKVETTNTAALQRSFLVVNSLAFFPRTCFVLTEAGLQVALTTAVPSSPFDGSGSNGVRPVSPVLVPHWDAELRTLSLNGQIVKAFRREAPNQEMILNAFQESSWTRRIDDPLPPEREIDSRVRLHDAIKSLNRNHITPLLRFRGDGSGKGVCWEVTETHP